MSGVQITNLALKSEIYGGINYYNIGSKLLAAKFNNDTYTSITYYLFDQYGQLLDTITLALALPFERYEYYTYGIFYVHNNNIGHWVNESVSSFQYTTYYNDVEYPDQYINTEYKNPQPLLLYKSINYYMRLLGRDYFTDELLLPANNGSYRLDVGRDKFIYAYVPDGDNVWYFRIYDFDYNLIVEYNTGIDSSAYNNIWAVKDRYILKLEYNGVYNFYFISPSGNVEHRVMSDYGNDEMINDYIWWD